MMEHTSVEQKLELIKTLRNEHNQNMDKIKRREEILYPEHNYYSSYYSKDTETDTDTKPVKSSAFFKFRVLISIILFLLFFFMDINQYHIYSITSDEIVNGIGTTLQLNSIDFINQLSYTLNDMLK